MFLIQTCFDSDLTKRNSFNYVFMYIPIGPSKKQLYKIIIALLLLVYLIFLGMYKPKAEVLNGVLQNNLLRLTTSGGNVDTNYNSNNIAHIQLSGDNINDLFELRSFFSYRAYYDRNNYHYKFSGYINSYQAGAFSSVVGVYTTDGSGTINGVCNFEGSGNQTQYTPFTVDCYVPGGLNLGNYSNILVFQFATTGNTPENNTNFWFHLNTQVAMYKIEDSNSQIASDTNDIKNNLNDSSIDSSSANDFTGNSAFQDSNGLDAIIKAPLNFIQSLTSSTCSSINLTIPYIDADVSLPCMSTIYNKALGQQLVNLIALVINGIVLYRYCLKILQIVKDAKNPNKDGLEVLDL